jgi:hypothetical protein
MVISSSSPYYIVDPSVVENVMGIQTSSIVYASRHDMHRWLENISSTRGAEYDNLANHCDMISKNIILDQNNDTNTMTGTINKDNSVLIKFCLDKILIPTSVPNVNIAGWREPVFTLGGFAFKSHDLDFRFLTSNDVSKLLLQ